MELITCNEFFLKKEKFAAKVEKGELFVYPTDTIYGLGCDATNETAVLKLRNTKRQHRRPLSVIAPSVEWIIENCEINDKVKEWCNKLPGPYTFILRLKNKNIIASSVTDRNSIGIRMPNHPIKKFVEILGVPIITTSANISGKEFMTSIEDLDSNIKNRVDFIVDTGEIQGSPSSIIFLDKEEVEIKKR